MRPKLALKALIIGLYMVTTVQGYCEWRNFGSCELDERLMSIRYQTGNVLCCKFESCRLAGKSGCRLNEQFLGQDPYNVSTSLCCDVLAAPVQFMHVQLFEQPDYEGKSVQVNQKVDCLDLDKFGWSPGSLIALQPVELFSDFRCLGERYVVPRQAQDLRQEPNGLPLPLFRSIGLHINDEPPREPYHRGFAGFDPLPETSTIQTDGQVTGQLGPGNRLQTFIIELTRDRISRSRRLSSCPDEILAPEVWCPFDEPAEGPADRAKADESREHMKNWENTVMELAAFHGSVILMVVPNYKDVLASHPMSIDMRAEFRMKHNNQLHVLRSKTLNQILGRQAEKIE